MTIRTLDGQEVKRFAKGVRLGPLWARLAQTPGGHWVFDVGVRPHFKVFLAWNRGDRKHPRVTLRLDTPKRIRSNLQ